MTPGTLTIDISPDKKELLVHVLYSSNKEAVMHEISEIQQKIKKFIY
jgi:multisubunit Na+/H+ antiporter MnhE subunit